MAKKRVRMNGPFAQKEQGKRAKKKLRTENQKEKDRFVTQGSEEDKKQLDAFKLDIDRMNVDMINFYGQGKAWLQNNKDNKEQPFQAFNDIYQRRLLLMCAMPLQRGINKESIAQSVGMAVGMALVNKQFRQNLHQSYANWQMNRAGGPNEYMLQAEKNPKMVNSINKHLLKANNGRIPFTEQSAAAMNIALAKQAYEGFRNPEMDDFDVGYNYQNAKDVLYDLAKADGISNEDLDRATRTMYGRLSQDDPVLKYMYKETAYRKVVIGDMEEDTYKQYDEYGNPTVKERYVWNGSFGDIENQQEFEGMFDVREKMTMGDFNNIVKDDMSEHLQWVEPEDFKKSGNAFFAGMIKSYGMELSQNFEYNEMMADHLVDYFSMGEYDGLKDVGEFDNISESLDYYNKTGDKSKMGMVESYYTTFEEVVSDYASKSPEHAKAVSEWYEDVKGYQKDFQKSNEKSSDYQRRPAEDNIDYDTNDDYSFDI